MARHWMALEFLKPEDELSLEEVGEERVKKLGNLGFFELDELYRFKYFKMHDVMHDLVLSIGEPTHQVINSETKKISNGVRYVSLNVEELHWEVLKDIRGKRNLESIISVSDHWKHCSIQGLSSSGFEKFVSSKLKILEVPSRGIEKVPNSISQMDNLRYLNLSRNPLRKIPNSITQLVHLLSLNVSFCPNLHELPRGITKLDKLEELKITGSIFFSQYSARVKLSHMPKGIGKLSNLEKLDFFVVVGEDRSISGRNSKASGAANLEELGCLNNLGERLWIIVDGESKHVASEAKTAKPLENKTELTRLVVEFKNSTEEDEMLLEGLQPNGKNLTSMRIINYGGKKLPGWMRDDHFHGNFPQLAYLEFFYDDKYQYWYYFGFRKMSFFHSNKKEYVVRIRMRNVDGHDGMLEWVPGHSSLKEQSRSGPIQMELTSVRGNGLKEFTVHSLTISKHISQSLLLNLDLERSFLNIQALHLCEISELQAIPNWIGSLTSLRELCIESCPKLESLPHQIGSLTSLRYLCIESCPKLESLPHQIGNLEESCCLIIRYCSQVLVDKCWKPTGEYWPFIQHLCYINITFSDDVHVRQGYWETWDDKNFRKETTALLTSNNASPSYSPPSNAPPALLTSNNASPSYSNTTSFKPYLFFILAFIMLILAYVVGFCLV